MRPQFRKFHIYLTAKFPKHGSKLADCAGNGLKKLVWSTYRHIVDENKKKNGEGDHDWHVGEALEHGQL